MEGLLTRILSTSEANRRNANKVVLYEDAAKKQLLEFISALRGCELMSQACSSLGESVEALAEDVPAKPVPSRCSSKRSRAAKVHNLSEKFF
ncbi:DNA mismatch repair protein [Arachis hypogaea]|nr:DNA mismatch repair protein [Arachis hypogaea]